MIDCNSIVIRSYIFAVYVHSLVYIVHTQCRYNIDRMYIVYFSTYRQEAHTNEVKAFSKHHSFFHAAVFYDMFSKKYSHHSIISTVR